MDYKEFKAEMWANMYVMKMSVPKIFGGDLHKEGLNMIQAYVLFKVGSEDSISVGNLSKELGLNQGNVSTVCKQMENNGLITRTRSSHDERVVTLSLTEKGTKTVSRFKSMGDQFDDALRKVSSDMLDTIINGVRAMNELLKIITSEQ